MENIEELKEHVKFVTNLCIPDSGLEELIDLSVKDEIYARLFLMAVSSIRDAASVREIFQELTRIMKTVLIKNLQTCIRLLITLTKR